MDLMDREELIFTLERSDSWEYSDSYLVFRVKQTIFSMLDEVRQKDRDIYHLEKEIAQQLTKYNELLESHIRLKRAFNGQKKKRNAVMLFLEKSPVFDSNGYRLSYSYMARNGRW